MGKEQVESGASLHVAVLRRAVLRMLYYEGLYYESKGQLYIIYKGDFLTKRT